jgi:pimeloyl-ACP methyl ester carboxylesterase/ketosteroid isomerase-like protein
MNARFVSGLILLVVIATAPAAAAQTPRGATAIARDTLLASIAELDARYFEAYNRCDLDALAAFHHPDLEAYHDLGGGPVGWETVRQGLERGVCAAPGRIRRALVPGTLAVYPMARFGAIQMADHLFVEAGEDGAERVVTAARMIALWRQNPGGWKISRMISYDHRPAPLDEARPARADGFETRVIEVDGRAVRVFTAGWEHLERGQPVVVFEAGGFSTLEAWGDLPARLARETAVMAYDRAGRGGSEWDGQRPTLEHVTSRLRRILEVLGAPPPYIHVGHSFGGPLGFAFARRYPDELAGLVLVDPTPPAADWLGAFDDIGVGRVGHEEFEQMFSRAFEGAPEFLLMELDILSSYLSDPDASPWSPPALSVPVAVLLAGAGYEVPPDLPSTFDLDQQHQALLLRQVVNYAEWTRTVPDATMIVANNSRHCIHCWDPELVIGAIRRVLYPDVQVRLRQAIATEGIAAIGSTYDAIKTRYPESHFDESRLESLGRELLGLGRSEAAIAVFELNVREYSQAVAPHESLGDAYRAAGRLDDARGSYERASHRAEASASPRLPALRRKLEDVEREQQRSRSDASQGDNRS